MSRVPTLDSVVCSLCFMRSTRVATIKIMRIPISGGRPELVFDAGVGFVQFTCAKSPSSNVCALNRVDQTGQIFSTYDLATRKMRDFAKVEKAADWDIFPDGSRIAVLIDEQARSRIRIVRLSRETEREFTVERSGIRAFYWSADGRGLYLAVRTQPGVSTFLYTDLRGHVSMVWEEKGDFGRFVWPSPDGRYLAITGLTTTRDAWLLENF